MTDEKNEKKKVNTRKIIINKSTFEIKEPLDYKDYTIALYVSVYDIGRPDNQDGTVDVVYKAKATGEMIIKDKHDKIYAKVDKRKNSKLLHDQLWHLGYDYETTAPIIRHLLDPYIIDLIEKYKRGEIE